MSATPPFHETLAKLKAAYAEALGNSDSELSHWYMLIDEHAEALFERVEEMQKGLESAALIITGQEKEMREARETLAVEIRRQDAVRKNHDAQIKALSEEPEKLRVEIARLKAEAAQHKVEIKELTTKHDTESLKLQLEVTEVKGLLARVFYLPLDGGRRVEHEMSLGLNAKIKKHLPPPDPSQRVNPYAAAAIAIVMNSHL